MNVQKTKLRIFGSMIAGAGTFGLALAVQAGEPATAPPAKHEDVVVRYADLNLNSADGAKTLYARLSWAAKRACGGTPMSPALDGKAYFDACYDRTLDHAVDKVDSQQVRVLHASRAAAKVG